MAAQIPADILAKFREVNEKNYKDQAIFYLNAFWRSSPSSEAEAETVWGLAELFAKEDHVKGKEGNELNPIQAFNLLQKQNKTLTALELKALLRKVDYDANGEMSLAEYLVGFNNRDPVEFINNPQGDIDPVKLKSLQDRLAELEKQFEELQVAQDAATKAEADAKEAEAAAVKQEAASKAAAEDAAQKAAAALAAQKVAEEEEANAKAAEEHAKAEEAVAAEAEAKALEATNKLKAVEDELRSVEDEARAIADEIKREEDSKAAEIARLEALSTDQSVGIVKRNMAVQQLASAKGEDPLPLRKAKLTQEAVVRRLAKITKAAADETAIAKVVSDEATAKREVATAAANKAQEARELAEKKRAEAVAAREAADAAKAKADEEYALAQQKRAEAVAAREAAVEALEEVKRQVAQCEASLAETSAELAALTANGTDSPRGQLWWIERTLEDKKRSLPTRMW